MALGGGNWLTQNKVLPGSYINFSSVAKVSAALSDRGYAAEPFVLSWDPEGEVFPVTSGEFQKNSKAIFGYGYDHPKLLALREIFQHATTVYCWRLGNGEKASCTYADAKYPGVRGNDLSIVIASNVDDTSAWDVGTYLDGQCGHPSGGLLDYRRTCWRGCASLWGDVVKLIRELEKIRAVENFDPDTVTCEQGDKKKAVLLTINGLNIINAMIQLYTSVIIQ